MVTDAQGFKDSTGEPAAIGVYFNKESFFRMTSLQLREMFEDAPEIRAHISIFEAYAPLVALRLAPERFRERRIGILIDNPAAAAVLKKLRGPTKKGPEQAELQRIAELYLWELTRLDARITEVQLVPGEQNPRADAVSRGLWNRLYLMDDQ
jgi:hypothetical protein